ncbi:hypothetical protein P171DRAFT_11820 [Karstenula rhodostoma CBS 690.94]|uniref:Heterokaryon incompatibility domain-containing protein n=1 Tax=Karstenula rhodostoma CBS 690.94 TaxID=1392251 RepID=A0A9P4PYS2_9PLEO|nr:hypothetical protein P171DRAFT_11820 [Karstenula rhodostoma CBS 690.94]
MGTIYKKATLVIAAAGANDSTEGLFITEGASTTRMQLPYLPNGVPHGYFNMSPVQRPYEPLLLDKSPLRQRAWAFQEWYLARRIVFFMPQTVQWKCITEEWQEEVCKIYPWSLHDDRYSWYTLIEEYSSRKFTFESDRLIALEGFIQDRANTTKQGDRCMFGTWENEIVRGLIWRFPSMEYGVSHGSATTFASWCWAAPGCEIRFWFGGVDDPCYLLPESIKMTESGTLDVRGTLLENLYRRRDFCFCCDVDHWGDDPTDSARCLIRDHTARRADNRLGIALFDRPVEDFTCFLLAKDKDAGPGNEEENYEIGYYVLLLEPIPDTLKQFKRVGIAMLFLSAGPLFANQKQKDFQIL